MRRVLASVFGTVTALVLLLSYKTTAAPVVSAARSSATTVVGSVPAPSATAAPAPTSTATSSSSSSSSSSTSSSAAGTTVTGDAVDTRYGPVQVQITLVDGKITAAQAVEYPENNGRDRQINSYAVPQLNSETVQAQGADIDMVSGATYTSQGYLASLQSALDRK